MKEEEEKKNTCTTRCFIGRHLSHFVLLNSALTAASFISFFISFLNQENQSPND